MRSNKFTGTARPDNCYIEGAAAEDAAGIFIEDSLMARSMMKEAWLERFGGSRRWKTRPP